MSFKVGDRVKIVNEGRTGVIKDLFRSWPVRYLVLRDALFKGEKGRFASVSEQNLEHIDPAQYALNEGFNDYMKAAGYDSKEKNAKYPIGTHEGEIAMDDLYYIVNRGCDDETKGLAIISDEEFPRFKQIIEDLNKNSQYGCMPTISIYKIDGSLIRPANDTDSAYDILYLNNAKYVLAKYIWRPRPNGRGTELVKGVEKVL